MYSRKEEAKLLAEHEAVVLQLRNAIAPATPDAVADNAVNGSVLASSKSGRAATLKSGESAKMMQTASRIIAAPSATAAATSGSASASASSSYTFFSPRQECYRVCGNPGDIDHDPSIASDNGAPSFVEVGSQMLAEEFSSMGTLEQCIRL